MQFEVLSAGETNHDTVTTRNSERFTKEGWRDLPGSIVLSHHAAMSSGTTFKHETFKDDRKKEDVRTANMYAARAVAEAIRTSLGPRGMDKMVSRRNEFRPSICACLMILF